MNGILRVVAGPNVGACFVLGARTRIGRAADSHIQLDEAHVSRQHARVVRLEDGAYELADLGSGMGTTVNGEPTVRRRLRPDDVIAIGGCRFEFAYADDAVTTEAFGRKSRGFAALRPTQSLPVVTAASQPELPTARPRRRKTRRKLPAMTDAVPRPTARKKPARVKLALDMPLSRPTDEAPPARAETPDIASASDEESDALLDAILGPEVSAMESLRVEAANEDSGDAFVAEPSPEPAAPRVTNYESSGPISLDPAARDAGLEVLRDVLDYRALRLDELRGGPLSGRDQARFDQLTTRLLVDTHGLPASRRFVRMPCALPATLTQCDGGFSRTLEVALEDLSAGGARLAMHDPTVRVGDEVWLAFDLAALFSFGRKVVFRSRVVWSDARAGGTGLMFGGHARFVDTVESAIATG
ncbi:MAG: FHA domain-containing protein [Nannocystaceae bacterium]|nr:FHA domain-containing protein [bacterium]